MPSFPRYQNIRSPEGLALELNQIINIIINEPNINIILEYVNINNIINMLMVVKPDLLMVETGVLYTFTEVEGIEVFTEVELSLV